MDRLPLTGIRVLDFSWVWAGPFCTLLLAHMGAEVIRVESSNRLCTTRRIPPFADNVAGVNRAGYYNQYNQGKLSITLNLRHPQGVGIARELARRCDVVTENFAAGVIERLGLGYETLSKLRPDLVMLSISGFGRSGPYRALAGYGPAVSALSGFVGATGYDENGPPQLLGISYADPSAGVLAAAAIVAALINRDRTGVGTYIDQSLLEPAVALLAEGFLDFAMNGREPRRIGNRDPVMAPHNCYKARGDANQWVTIAVGTQREWRNLCRAMDNDQLADDPRFCTEQMRKRNEDALDEIISRWTAARDRWDITRALQDAEVCAFPSLSNKDLAHDPHLRQRGFMVAKEHPEVGRRLHAGIPWTLGGNPVEIRQAAPLLGADTDSMLGELLGLDAPEIDRLRRLGVLE
jgi:benzylsuccinate CoA-transferase BbsF subunit